jgi:hypothetical protein
VAYTFIKEQKRGERRINDMVMMLMVTAIYIGLCKQALKIDIH